jgi:hypothetical protein
MIDPNEFSIIIIGGRPGSEADVHVLGVLEGSLGGPDTRLNISLQIFDAPERDSISFGKTPVAIDIDFGDPGGLVGGTQVGLAASDDWLLV